MSLCNCFNIVFPFRFYVYICWVVLVLWLSSVALHICLFLAWNVWFKSNFDVSLFTIVSITGESARHNIQCVRWVFMALAENVWGSVYIWKYSVSSCNWHGKTTWTLDKTTHKYTNTQTLWRIEPSVNLCSILFTSFLCV